jgi:uncharacterized protein (DUF2461 family)
VAHSTSSGFTPEAFLFFEAVAPDVSWTAVQQRREEWERAVHIPMEDLLDALASEFGETSYAYNLHRDPWLWRHQLAGVEVADTIGYRVELSLDGLRCDGGWFLNSSDQIERYRAAVQDDALGAELVGLAEHLRADGLTIDGDRLRTAPRGVSSDHPRIDLLRHRTLVASRWIDATRVTSPACGEDVAAVWRSLRPLVTWLATNVRRREGR